MGGFRVRVRVRVRVSGEKRRQVVSVPTALTLYCIFTDGQDYNPVTTGKIIIIVTISNEYTLDNANCIHHAAVQHNINDSTNYRHNSQCQCTIRLYYSA